MVQRTFPIKHAARLPHARRANRRRQPHLSPPCPRPSDKGPGHSLLPVQARRVSSSVSRAYMQTDKSPQARLPTIAIQSTTSSNSTRSVCCFVLATELSYNVSFQSPHLLTYYILAQSDQCYAGLWSLEINTVNTCTALPCCWHGHTVCTLSSCDPALDRAESTWQLSRR